MRKKYIIRLDDKQREQLKEVVTKGKTEAYKIKHANILLAADINSLAWSDQEIARVFSVRTNTVANIRQRLAMGGLESALSRKKQAYPSRKPIFDGAAEAHLIAISCSQPPEGYNHWTVRLLADRVVQLRIVEQVSRETIRRTLKKRAQATFG